MVLKKKNLDYQIVHILSISYAKMIFLELWPFDVIPWGIFLELWPFDVIPWGIFLEFGPLMWFPGGFS